MRREDDNYRTHVDGIVPEHVDEDRLPDGTDVEGYVIDGILGKGGMGVVYSATHRVIGKRAAIKVLRTEVSKNPLTVDRFIQEARAVNQIGHPNIIDIFDFGTLADGRVYHLMDLMDGESLRQRLRRGPLHASEAASVIGDVASALAAAHDKGFIHRDLKPDNVYLITQRDSWPLVKLLDFGLAKLMPEAGTAAFITKTGVMLGTPEYMSPEQARGIGVDYRTDIYALGVVMFEILTGARPFPPADAFTTLQYHAEEPPPSLAAILPDLPPEMVQLVDAMLAKEPAARPSLAAVQTVIKRLRTTQLPTRSVAGVELAAFSNPNLVSHLGQGPRHSDSLPTRPALAPPVASLPSLPSLPTKDSAPALARRDAVHASTTLGVPPPGMRRAGPTRPPALTAPDPATISSRAWLIAGALIAIAAGVMLALVLTGTI